MNNPLTEFVSSLPHHERTTLLHVLEVAKGPLIMNCEEKKLYEGLCLALWKSIKVEEIK